jgi:thiamine pyrophosphokinase
VRHVRYVIFANGDISDPDAIHQQLREEDVIVAADGGIVHVMAMGLKPNAVIGDLDSAPAELISLARGADIRSYPREKDKTDLELALDFAAEGHASEVLIVGALGGRLDHALANILVAGRQPIHVTMREAEYEILFIRESREITGRPGDIVTLLALNGRAGGVATEGLKYGLASADLHAGSSLGVSNEMLGTSATVRVDSGVVMVIHQSPIESP